MSHFENTYKRWQNAFNRGSKYKRVIETHSINTLPKSLTNKFMLTEVGSERINEIADPEIAISRAIETYRKKGYSENWITQRMKTIETRKDLIAEWKISGVKNPS